MDTRQRSQLQLGMAALAAGERSAFPPVFLVAPLALVARLIGRPAELVLAVGGGLAVFGFALAMLHDRYARAVLAGVLAGLPGLAIPVVVRSLGIVRLGETALDPCLPASFISGILAGVFVSLRAVDEKHRLSYWFVAAVTSAAAGALGCSVVGGAGVLGLMAGIASGTAPVLLRRRLRRG